MKIKYNWSIIDETYLSSLIHRSDK